MGVRVCIIKPCIYNYTAYKTYVPVLALLYRINIIIVRRNIRQNNKLILLHIR